eukprot:scaffold261588_cov18-Prasinocladus_malaysianus.AAC.1
MTQRSENVVPLGCTCTVDHTARGRPPNTYRTTVRVRGATGNLAGALANSKLPLLNFKLTVCTDHIEQICNFHRNLISCLIRVYKEMRVLERIRVLRCCRRLKHLSYRTVPYAPAGRPGRCSDHLPLCRQMRDAGLP